MLCFQFYVMCHSFASGLVRLGHKNMLFGSAKDHILVQSYLVLSPERWLKLLTHISLKIPPFGCKCSSNVSTKISGFVGKVKTFCSIIQWFSAYKCQNVVLNSVISLGLT